VEVQQVKLGVFLRAYHCRRQYYPDCSNERCCDAKKPAFP
jgi:hypothetical protein